MKRETEEGGVMDEVKISRAITETFLREFTETFETDAVIVGAGPSGLVCASHLAEAGLKVAVFEKHLKVGGGMPGGGMMFNRIVVQDEARSLLEECGVSTREYEDGLFVAHSLEATAALTYTALRKGAKIYNLMVVEDVVIRPQGVRGVVLNWTAVESAHLHIDPLAVRTKVVVDATGHGAEICTIVERKSGTRLQIPQERIPGEKPMWAEVGEKEIVGNTREVYPGLIACGMAANAVFGSPRMGPVFGGMLLSGKRAAEIAVGLVSGAAAEVTEDTGDRE